MFDWLFRYANPARFMGLSGTLLPWLVALTVLTIGTGLYLGFSAPPDYQQGRTVLILFIHVPAATVMEMAYGAIVIASLFSLVNRHILADVAARTRSRAGDTVTPVEPGAAVHRNSTGKVVRAAACTAAISCVWPARMGTW